MLFIHVTDLIVWAAISGLVGGIAALWSRHRIEKVLKKYNLM